MAPPIRIAMLNTDTPVPNVLAKRGSYGNIFHRLLSAAAKRTTADLDVEASDYDVRCFEYPASVSGFDAVLVTGSAAAAYDDVEWVRRLEAYVLDVYVRYPRVKLFGSCFGHQLICRSLLRGYGVVVEKDPKGWELGVKEIRLTEAFRMTLGRGLASATPRLVPERLRLQFVHADHVRVSLGALPSSWMVLGSTEHCAVQGVYQPGRVLTYQGHFEFDRFVNMEVLRVFGAAWDPVVLQDALEACDADDDAEVAAELVVQFLREASDVKGPVTRAVVGGLLTPPLAE